MKFFRTALPLVGLTLFFDASLGQQTCIENFADIYEAEGNVKDLSVQRTYVLCPRRIYEIGTLDFNYNLQGFQVQPPLPLRSNVNIRCGDTGDKSNLCWIAEGDVQLDATNYLGLTGDSVDNVSIDGLVFIGARRYSLWASKKGDITFRNCEWRDFTKSVVPILLDYFDPADSSSSLSVTFENCLFHDNRYFGWGSHSSLIYGNSAQNEITIKETIFENNDLITNNTMSTKNSFIIETLGPLTIEGACFENNAVGVSNTVVFGNQLSATGVFVSNSTGQTCAFASVFQTVVQLDNFQPICVSSLESSCYFTETKAPTSGPTESPTTHAPTASAPTKLVTPSPTQGSDAVVQKTITTTPSEAPVSPPSPAPTPGNNASPGSNFVWPTEAPEEASVASTRWAYSYVVEIFVVLLAAVMLLN